MNVHHTVMRMMLAYPSLYRTRVMALLNLFDASHTDWKDGELVHLYPEEYAPRNFLEDESAAVAAYEAEKHDNDPGLAVRDLLHLREQNAKSQFVHDNAELLAANTSSNFGKGYPISFSGRHFDDMPDNVAPDWLEAAKELAHAIRGYTYINVSGYVAEYVQRNEKELEHAKKICTKFLERFRVVPIDPYTRAARIAELQREAAALGLQLTERTAEV